MIKPEAIKPKITIEYIDLSRKNSPPVLITTERHTPKPRDATAVIIRTIQLYLIFIQLALLFKFVR